VEVVDLEAPDRLFLFVVEREGWSFYVSFDVTHEVN
jgi:hypothetical protein